MMTRISGVVAAMVLCAAGALSAQGTKLWTQSRYDEMERGTSDGVAIRNDGRLEVAPATKLLYTASGNLIWSIAVDASGHTYLGRGGTASGTAIITRLTQDDTATDIFAGKELAAQALAVAADGTLFAATSPDGKVYRIDPGAATGKPGTAAAAARVIFDPAQTAEKPRYLWDLALGRNGELYIAAGAPAVVYKVPQDGGKAVVLFRTSDQHIRCLRLAPDGTLYAGSDGTGVIYKIDPNKAAAAPFAVYSAPRREITSLAVDSSGTLYAAAVGGKGAIPLPNISVTGTTGTSIVFVQPASATAAAASTVIPEGSEVYRIAPDGTPSRLLALKDDVVYALAMDHGSLLAATGNRGRVYRIDTAVAGRWTDVAHLDASQGIAFAAAKDGLLIATSNSGRAYQLSDEPHPDATFISAVFDSQTFSQWGRAEVLPAVPSSFDLYVRSGNVENPASGWSEWSKVTPIIGSTGVPGARYAQWKAILNGSALIESVGLNYLPRNLAPVVDDIVVQPGARLAPAAPASNVSVMIAFPASVATPPAVPFPQDGASVPLNAQKDKTAVTVRWSAHDDNGDDLVFAVYYKGDGEANWRLLKDKISDRFYSFDSSLLPDGTYMAKVVASDAPAHAIAAALTGERASSAFVVDTTPPVPGVLAATMESGKIHAKFEARDATSPIAHAEYSIDAGPWQYLEPTGTISDSLAESYDFLVTLPIATAVVTNSAEHVLAVRVYDRYENAVTAKAVVR